MNIIVITAIGMCLAVALMFFLFRPYDYGGKTQRFLSIGREEGDSESDEDTEWRSARIRPGLNCCAMARNLEGHVFLSRDVPPLPLAYCSESDCSCHYLFEGDRRSGLDRRAELARVGAMLSGIERRRLPGRRIDDPIPA